MPLVYVLVPSMAELATYWPSAVNSCTSTFDRLLRTQTLPL